MQLLRFSRRLWPYRRLRRGSATWSLSPWRRAASAYSQRTPCEARPLSGAGWPLGLAQPRRSSSSTRVGETELAACGRHWLAEDAGVDVSDWGALSPALLSADAEIGGYEPQAHPEDGELYQAKLDPTLSSTGFSSTCRAQIEFKSNSCPPAIFFRFSKILQHFRDHHHP